MKPNILFLTIDSLRADKCYDAKKTSKTPNLDKLLDDGISFHQAISSSDSTGNSIGSIFSGLYSFKSGITHFNFNKIINLFTDDFKKNGYTLFSIVPDISFFKQLTARFDNIDTYVYDKRESWLQLDGGIGDQILEKLRITKDDEPWFCFIHLMDLHAPFFIPKQFDKMEYGENRYERMLSYIDTWLGKIINTINTQNTLFILSSDHGDYIPLNDNQISYNTLQKRIIRKIKQIFPRLDPLLTSLYTKYLEFQRKRKIQTLKTKNSSDEIRAFNIRAGENLFDESLLIPLVFYGYGITTTKKIFTQVRQIDIFPTILDICQIPCTDNIDGQSLLPLFVKETIDETPCFIETGSRNPKQLGDVIGIRTSQYKYLRSRNDSKSNIRLFDLRSDPLERVNLAEMHPEIVKKMECVLDNMMKNTPKQNLKQMDDDETRKIQEELRKLGYL